MWVAGAMGISPIRFEKKVISRFIPGAFWSWNWTFLQLPPFLPKSLMNCFVTEGGGRAGKGCPNHISVLQTDPVYQIRTKICMEYYLIIETSLWMNFCEGFSIETFTLNSRCGGWLGVCMLTLAVYLL